MCLKYFVDEMQWYQIIIHGDCNVYEMQWQEVAMFINCNAIDLTCC